MVNLLEKYSQYLKTGDAGGIAALFTEDGEFYDDVPSKLGLQPISVRGRESIEAFFRKMFEQGGLNVTNVAINGNAMRYDVAVGEALLLCLGVVREEDNLIKGYRVTAV